MLKAGEAVWEIKGDLKQLDGALAQGAASVEATTQKANLSLSQIGMGMTAVGAAITAPLALGVKAAGDFGSAMAGVASLGVQDIGALETAVRDTAVAYGQDLTGAAEATYQMISAGASEMEAPYILEQAAKAATAGQTDLTTAIELGMAMTNAFGGSLSDIEGVFDSAFTAVKYGVATFEELSASAGKTAPAFASAGLSLDEMYASVAALTKGGLGTSEAFTQMNAVITGFTRQGEGAKLSTLGLQGALEWLKTETGGNKTEMLEFLGSTEAMGAMLSLTGSQAQSFGDIMQENANKAGNMNEAFNIIAESDPTFAWNQLKSTMQDLAITVGQALLPALASIVETVTPILKNLADWMKQNEELTAGIVMAAGAVGAFMVTVGPLLMVLPGLIALFGAIGPVVTAVGGALVAAAGIISGPVLLAIGALVAAGTLIYQNWEEMKQGADVLWDGIKAAFQFGMDAVVGLVTGSVNAIVAVWETLTGAAGFVVDSVISAFSWMGEGIANAFSGLVGFFSGIWDSIVDVFEGAWDYINEIVNNVLGGVWEVIAAIGGLLGFDAGANMPATQARARGGDVIAGNEYLIGEEGPELFIPRTSGSIIPAKETAAMMGGGNTTISINLNGLNVKGDYDVDRLVQRMGEQLRQRLTGIGATAEWRTA